jgi:hypothetical protein
MPSEPEPFEAPLPAPPPPAPPHPKPLRGWLLGRFLGACASGLLCISGAVLWLYFPLPVQERIGPLGAVALSGVVAFLVWMPFWGWVFSVCMEGRVPTWRSVATTYVKVLADVGVPFMEVPTYLLVTLVRTIRPAGLLLLGVFLLPLLISLALALSETGVAGVESCLREWPGFCWGALAVGLVLSAVGVGLRPRLEKLAAHLDADIERRIRGRLNWVRSLLH